MPKSTVDGIINSFGERDIIAGKGIVGSALVSAPNSRLLIKIYKKLRHLTLRDIASQWNDDTELNVSWECCKKCIHECGLGF